MDNLLLSTPVQRGETALWEQRPSSSVRACALTLGSLVSQHAETTRWTLRTASCDHQGDSGSPVGPDDLRTPCGSPTLRSWVPAWLSLVRSLRGGPPLPCLGIGVMSLLVGVVWIRGQICYRARSAWPAQEMSANTELTMKASGLRFRVPRSGKGPRGFSPSEELRVSSETSPHSSAGENRPKEGRPL